jgi:hypothetical protein
VPNATFRAYWIVRNARTMTTERLMMRLKLAPMGLDPRVHQPSHHFSRRGWIAPNLGLARGPHINKVPQVGYTRLAVSRPAMTASA